MTLEDIEAMHDEFLSIPLVAEYLEKNLQTVRNSIRRGVPWGYMMSNADFRIPRRAFVSYHKNGAPIAKDAP